MKVPFYGNEIIVIEKGDRQYVAMKPIVQGLNLDWDTQFRNIKNDPVLNSTVVVMTMVAEDGKQREMLCLPVEYLNGWLFRIPASRYTGKKRETIIRYQKECYQVLYDYFHNGGTVNQNANNEQVADLLKSVAVMTATAISETVGKKLFELSEEMRQMREKYSSANTENSFLKMFCPKGKPGEISDITGLPKDRFVRAYFTSNRSATPVATLYVQLELPLGL